MNIASELMKQREEKPYKLAVIELAGICRELEKQLRASEASNTALAKALDATNKVKSFMTMPRAYWDDEWSNEKRYDAAKKEMDKYNLLLSAGKVNKALAGAKC
jgi:hypothetical protein